MNDDAAPEPQGRAGSWVGFALLLVLLAYAGAIHHGVGPAKPGQGDRWYTPTNFLFDSEIGFALLEPPGLAFVTLGLPALLLLVAVLLFTRSAFAMAIGTSCVLAVQLFVFYGVVAPFPWRFFGWSASAVLILIAVSVGFALAAPRFAKSWLSLGWPVRVLLYLPFVVFVVAFLRNATGTDPSLPFAISPWPAVPVFGLEVGALFVAIALVGTAVGVTGVAHSGDSRGRAVLAVGAGLVAPALLLAVGSWLGMFPFRVGPRLVIFFALVCGLAIAAATTLQRHGPDALTLRARHLSVGALLLALPLMLGQAWAFLDYWVTREFRARQIIDALAAHLERETLYPDDLEQLVSAGDLAAIPLPAIGFAFLYDGRFDYQGFGTSYLMEFPAPRWVQCAYTPAVLYEDFEEEYGDDDDFSEEDLLESWSCPSRPPELW